MSQKRKTALVIILHVRLHLSCTEVSECLL
jgi:hypothetical protein